MHPVIGDEMSREWVESANEQILIEAAKAKATSSSRSKRKQKERDFELGPANRSRPRGPAPEANMDAASPSSEELEAQEDQEFVPQITSDVL